MTLVRLTSPNHILDNVVMPHYCLMEIVSKMNVVPLQ